MQLLDTQDTLHYSIRGPASGNTSLPDVDSIGLRHIRRPLDSLSAPRLLGPWVPEVVAAKKTTASSLRKWRNGLLDSGLNAGQRSVVEKVADRVLAQEFAGSARCKTSGQSRSDMAPLVRV